MYKIEPSGNEVGIYEMTYKKVGTLGAIVLSSYINSITGVTFSSGLIIGALNDMIIALDYSGGGQTAGTYKYIITLPEMFGTLPTNLFTSFAVNTNLNTNLFSNTSITVYDKA